MNYIFSNFLIHNNGIVSKNFLNLGVKSFHSAIDWVKSMPYGRNNDRSNYLSIFSEHRGTCSTKHALLSALALENNQNIILKMVICKVDKYSNKSIESLLKYLKIDYFPEAHCIISNDKGDLDITFPGYLRKPKAEIVKSYKLKPTDIGEKKIELHRNYLIYWMNEKGLNKKHSLEEIWNLREKWIFSLSNKFNPIFIM